MEAVYSPTEAGQSPATKHDMEQILPNSGTTHNSKSLFWDIMSSIWDFVTGKPSAFPSNVENPAPCQWREKALQQLEKLLVTVTVQTMDLKEQSLRGRISEGEYQKLISAQGRGARGGATDFEMDWYEQRLSEISMLWKEIMELEILLLEVGSMNDERE
ncbi:hypothetical protein L211DRAFT_846094 [Terfezia boudieri ATCC MYA-4762]|uniref:Uncharacterized protein n=1 Tax=Terfezia boudieri ATCC MYA-4762 TaxID=1051890 RepID=A0A3N4LZ03_9PEZI|nr:hypothetical protein L211DRAFT_846094 [Terfezia boudieri ATCC MYA-4762]